MNDISLQDIIDVDRLAEVQEKLSDMMSVSAVTVDRDGTPISNLNNFSPLCQLIRSTEKGQERCILCDKKACELAIHLGAAISYDCHIGLKDCCAPIVVDNVMVGAVLGGQVLLNDAKLEDNIQNLMKLEKEFDLPHEELINAIDKIPVVKFDYLKKCLDLYKLIANYSKEMGLKYLAQQKLLDETQKKLEFEQRAKYAELKSIEAQINPHFLFNTLNSIARMAMFEEANDTEEMIFNLSDLLRYNLRQINEFPTLHTEMENIRRYLLLQKVRYQDRLNYSILLDSKLEKFLIPSMILQPLVENAIIHGLEPLSYGGRLEIECLEVDDQLKILIKDTGIGIPESKKATLLDSNCFNGHLGVMNSHLRIQDYFGKVYGLKLMNNDQYTTIIELTFPKITTKAQIRKEPSLCVSD
ncbi:sensor histidine kinase [Niallia hominis]|uniref:PocR ligand-binding domain-containing protein n=1 Tax=Niallia hominis TaxID=3133173 RepID=A0ABV1EY61_9BACI